MSDVLMSLQVKSIAFSQKKLPKGVSPQSVLGSL